MVQSVRLQCTLFAIKLNTVNVTSPVQQRQLSKKGCIMLTALPENHYIWIKKVKLMAKVIFVTYGLL